MSHIITSLRAKTHVVITFEIWFKCIAELRQCDRGVHFVALLSCNSWLFSPLAKRRGWFWFAGETIKEAAKVSCMVRIYWSVPDKVFFSFFCAAIVTAEAASGRILKKLALAKLLPGLCWACLCIRMATEVLPSLSTLFILFINIKIIFAPVDSYNFNLIFFLINWLNCIDQFLLIHLA